MLSSYYYIILWPLNFLSLIYLLIVGSSFCLCFNFIQLCTLFLDSLKCYNFYPIRRKISTIWWYFICILCELWGNVKFIVYGDHINPLDNSLLITNHGPGLDFFSSVILTSKTIGTGQIMTMLKDSLKYYPLLGWIHYYKVVYF